PQCHQDFDVYTIMHIRLHGVYRFLFTPLASTETMQYRFEQLFKESPGALLHYMGGPATKITRWEGGVMSPHWSFLESKHCQSQFCYAKKTILSRMNEFMTMKRHICLKVARKPVYFQRMHFGTKED